MSQTTKAVWQAVLAYVAWGFLPLYWKLIEAVPAWEILAHRILWSAVLLAVLILLMKRGQAWRSALSNRRAAVYVLLCSLFITINWLVFIWAVNNGHVLETSLGYYMNPIINVLLAVLFLKERPRMGQWLAILLATIGVAVQAVEYGQLPWVSLVLALSFGFYGLFKKNVRMDAIIGLSWETTFVVPIALGYLIFLRAGGQDSLPTLSGMELVLLLLAGAATVLPLYWFSQATRYLPLSLVGFLQYIGPSITLILGILVFKESFDATKLISFAFIWSAVILYSWSSWKGSQQNRARANNVFSSQAADVPASAQKV